MVEEASFEFRLRKIEEVRSYLLDEIKHNDLMSGKYNMTCKYLNSVQLLCILISTVTGCLSVSVFALLVAILLGIMSSAVGIKVSLQDSKNISNL